MPNSSMLTQALVYLGRGWSVVPAHTVDPSGQCSCRHIECNSPGKHPRIRWAQYQITPATAEQGASWWSRRGWEGSNIAVVTGRVSGLVVIDIDPRHGGDESVRANPEQFRGCAHQALTGGGGTHYYYTHPLDADISNAVNLLPGVDVRGDGGYVIAPPSSHASGQHYEWEASTDWGLSLEPLSIELLGRIRNYERPFGEDKHATRSLPDVEGVLAGTVRIPDGERNDTLARFAGRYSGEGKTREETLLLVQGINTASCDPALADREVDSHRALDLDARASQDTRHPGDYGGPW